MIGRNTTTSNPVHEAEFAEGQFWGDSSKLLHRAGPSTLVGGLSQAWRDRPGDIAPPKATSSQMQLVHRTIFGFDQSWNLSLPSLTAGV